MWKKWRWVKHRRTKRAAMPRWIVTFDEFEKMNRGRWQKRRRTRRGFILQRFISVGFVLIRIERAAKPKRFSLLYFKGRDGLQKLGGKRNCGERQTHRFRNISE